VIRAQGQVLKLKTAIFLSLQSIRLLVPFQGLNSSLAQSTGKLELQSGVKIAANGRTKRASISISYTGSEHADKKELKKS